MRVIIKVMDKRMKKKWRHVRKDIQIHTIKFHDPWCHGTSEINDMGNY